MGTYIARFFVTLLLFLATDAVWLGVAAKNMYSKTIGHLMSDKPNLYVALLFYIFYVIGIIVFALNPALKNKSPVLAVELGALLGFIAYSTYDLTNLATLKNWPVQVTVIDIVWGTVLTAAVTLFSYLILR